MAWVWTDVCEVVYERDVLEEVVEPFLIQQGLVQRTPRGRMLTVQGWRYIGMEAPRSVEAQMDLLSASDDDASGEA